LRYDGRVYKFLILGADGFLGGRWLRKDSLTCVYQGTTRKENYLGSTKLFFFDALNLLSIDELILTIKPDVVVNCIALKLAMSDANKVNAEKINVLFPQYLAQIAHKYHFKFVQISTDHFESKNNEVRDERVKAFPINTYGYSKMKAEELVIDADKKAIIIRTSFFGYEANSKSENLLAKIRDSVLRNIPFTAFSDVYFSPVSVSNLIEIAHKLVLLDFSGIINVSSNESISQHEFALITSRHLNATPSIIQSGSVLDLETSVQRVKYRSLDNSLLKSVLIEPLSSMNDMIVDELQNYPSTHEKSGFYVK